MASIATDRRGNRRLLFVDNNGIRRTVRLGKVSLRVAESIKCRIEHIVAAKCAGAPLDADTARWLGSIDDSLRDRLARVGLCEARLRATLGDFVQGYIERRSSDVKQSTREAWQGPMKALVEYFGADRYVDQITAADAEDYRLWLTRRGLASATVHKHIRIARQLWGDAMLRRLATTNPFAAVKASATPNPERKRFITREETARLLEACNPTWRVIVALCRYGGLRCPSEVLSLRWEDVLWDRGRIVVHSPKTEHHAGKATRIVPLFPELREILAEAFAQAADGSVYVVEAPRYRRRGIQSWKACNMRTQFLRIVKRAGLQPWPRLFHNLRASRATELAAEYPQHVLTAWLGHSPDVAERHYLQVREEDFQRAAYGVQKGGAKSGALEAQNAAQQPFADFRNEQQPIGASADESTHYVASRCKDRQAAEDREWAHEDSNTRDNYREKRIVCNRAAQNPAHFARDDALWQVLARLWRQLSGDDQAALVRQAQRMAAGGVGVEAR